jgi:hypothetical protein
MCGYVPAEVTAVNDEQSTSSPWTCSAFKRSDETDLSANCYTFTGTILVASSLSGCIFARKPKGRGTLISTIKAASINGHPCREL